MRSKLMQAAAVAALGVSLGATSTDVRAQSAQAEQNAGTDRIIVTARKREESLLDTPTPVTAIAPDQIDSLRLRDARDLIQLVPSAYLQENNAGTARDISIRGVSTPTLFAEPGVALYIDEIYSSGFISYPTQFRDLERVEVLRGPQGALYGRNAVGGAVNVISKRPEDEFGAGLRATYARYDRYEVEGVVNMPLGERGGLRALGWYVDQDEGEYFNETLGEFLDTNDSAGGRLVGAFNVTDAFSLEGVVEHEDASGPGTFLFFPTGGETRTTIRRDTQPSNEWETTRFSVAGKLETSFGEFSVVGGGRNYELDGIEDTDLSDSTVVNLATGQLGRQVLTRTNEIDSRFVEGRWLSPEMGRLSLLAGFNYLNESATGDILTDLQSLSQALSGGLAPFTLGIANDQSVTSWAGFAEATLQVTDRLSLIASARYTSDEKSVDFVFTPSPALFGFVGPVQTASLSDTFDNFSPGGTIAYELTDAIRIYGKVQTGFRAGGFNFNVADAANLPYQEETSINYEIGAKAALPDDRGLVAASVYLLNQDDVLVPVLDVTAAPGLQAFLINAGEARTVGVEVEASFEVFDGFNLQGSFGYQDGEFSSGVITNASGAQVDIDGNELPAARRWTSAIVATYRNSITPSVDLVANTSYTRRSPGFQDVENTFEIGGNNLVNISAGVETEHFGILGFVQNAGNDRYDIAFGGFRPPDANGVIQAQGVTYGVTVTADF